MFLSYQLLGSATSYSEQLQFGKCVTHKQLVCYMYLHCSVMINRFDTIFTWLGYQVYYLCTCGVARQVSAAENNSGGWIWSLGKWSL